MPYISMKMRRAHIAPGAGGEAILQALRVGSGWRDSPLIGFSGDTLAASNRRTVGQGCKGPEGSCSMGWVQGKGSAKAPFPVSMKWSWGYRGQQERSPDCRSSGQGACAWFGAGGEANLQALRVVNRRYGWMALEWAQCPGRATAWGMQRGRAAAPLPRWFCITKHILRPWLRRP